jgi:putative ATP-dependent endonuclease of OLD family
VWENNFVIWPENISTSIKSDYTDDKWNTWKAEAESELGHVGGVGKNSIFVSAMMAKAWAKGKASATLEKLCKILLEFANRVTT